MYSIGSITLSKEDVPLGPQKVGWSTMMSSPCAYSVMRRQMSGKSVSPWLKSPRRKQGSSPVQLMCSQWAIASQSARTVWGWQYMDKIQNWSVLVCTWAAIALPGRISFSCSSRKVQGMMMATPPDNPLRSVSLAGECATVKPISPIAMVFVIYRTS